MLRLPRRPRRSCSAAGASAPCATGPSGYRWPPPGARRATGGRTRSERPGIVVRRRAVSAAGRRPRPASCSSWRRARTRQPGSSSRSSRPWDGRPSGSVQPVPGGRMKLVLNTWLAFQTEGAAEVAAWPSAWACRSGAVQTPFETILWRPLRPVQAGPDGRGATTTRLRPGLGPEGPRPGGRRPAPRSPPWRGIADVGGDWSAAAPADWMSRPPARPRAMTPPC